MNSSRHHLNGEEAAADAAKQFNFLENTLLKHRTLTIFGEINKEVAQRTAEKLLALSFEGDAPITIFIGSPGGHVESGDTIYDIIRFIKPVVRTVGTGWVGSIATHIYLAPAEGEPLRAAEYALPDSPAVRRLRRRRHRHRDSGARDHQNAPTHQSDDRGTNRPADRTRCAGYRSRLLDEPGGIGGIRSGRTHHQVGVRTAGVTLKWRTSTISARSPN